MSEANSSQPAKYPGKLKKLIAATTAILALAACDNVEPTEPTAKAPSSATMRGMQRCFAAPQPVRNIVTDNLESHLALSKTPDGKIQGDPGPLKQAVREKVAGAAIKIYNLGPGSSGFLLRPDLAVVAAHSAYTADVSTMHIKDKDGKTSAVVAGCYMFEKGGEFADPMAKGSGDIDVAIIRLAQPLGSSVLNLAQAEANREEWATFFNYQGSRDHTDPAEYNGIVLGEDNYGDIILTGIQPWRNCEPTKNKSSDCAIEPGASGGVVVNWTTGEVVGISVKGTADGYIKNDAIEPLNAAMVFDFGPGTGAMPKLGLTTDVEYIKLACQGFDKIFG